MAANRVLLPLLLGAACSGDGGKGEFPEDIERDFERCVAGDLLLDDTSGYTLSYEVTVAPLLVASKEPVVVDLSGLTEDVMGRPLDPTSLQLFNLINVEGLSAEEAMEALATETLASSELRHYGVGSVEEGRVSLEDVVVQGSAFDPGEHLEDDDSVWIGHAGTSLSLGDGQHVFFVLEPDDEAEEIEVILTAPSVTLVAQTDLSKLQPLGIDGGELLSVDWSAVSTTAMGHDLSQLWADTIRLGRLDDIDADELDDSFLYLETFIGEQWSWTNMTGDDQIDLAPPPDDGRRQPLDQFVCIHGVGVVQRQSNRITPRMFSPLRIASYPSLI